MLTGEKPGSVPPLPRREGEIRRSATKPKGTADPVSHDVHRDRILRFLYERHRSARGPAKILIGIRDLQKEMRNSYRMSQQEVSSNLDYLVQVGWVREVVKERSFTTPGGMELSQEQVKYKISDIGINHLQAGTMFKKPESTGQVNITNVKGVTIVGDGNVVNTQYTDLSRALDDLDKKLSTTPKLSDEQKVEAVADLSTIRAQIAKQHPSHEIVRAAWHSLESIATIAGVLDAFVRTKDLLSPLLGG
jgi:hypothetical protein